VRNTGNVPLVFNAATPTATAGLSISGNFAIAAGTTCVNGGSVAVNGSCVINVTFSPTTVGANAGTLTLRDNAGTQTVSLSGTATQGAVTFTAATAPATVSTNFLGLRVLGFGNLTGAQFSVVTLTNSGNAPVTFGTATVANVLGTAFSKGADTCSGSTVAAGNTCTIRINFAAPAGNSARIGALSVPDNGANSPQSLVLTGS